MQECELLTGTKKVKILEAEAIVEEDHAGSHITTEPLVGGEHLNQPHSYKKFTEYISQDCIHMGFEYLQRGKLCNFSGQPIPILCPIPILLSSE